MFNYEPIFTLKLGDSSPPPLMTADMYNYRYKSTLSRADQLERRRRNKAQRQARRIMRLNKKGAS